MSNTTQLLITGCKGRMGQAVYEAASEEQSVKIASQVDLGDDLASALAKADTVIDFTLHGFTNELLDACLAAKSRLVMGTTGHTDDELARISEASKEIPIVHAPNFSIGVNTLFWLTGKATEILGDDFDLEVIEMHHRHKQDAPSGTARRLAEILAEKTSVSYDNDVMHGRHGDVGARTAKEIGMHSMRGGDVVGDHTVVYATNGERVELTHKASSRMTFAKGAVRAAVWLREQNLSSGLFDMQDVLGLR